MRIAVFIDYENIARSACRAFQLPKDDSNHEQLNLEQLGKQLAIGNKRTQQTTKLATIEIHRGLPNQNRDPQANQSARYWQNHWEKTSQLVTIKFRPLRYRKDRDNIIRGEEKVVDVQLAVNTIRWIMKNECDTAIIFSHDSDFSPLIEMLAETEGPHCIETASWYAKTHRQRIPEHPGVYNHYLNHTDYLDLTQH